VSGLAPLVEVRAAAWTTIGRHGSALVERRWCLRLACGHYAVSYTSDRAQVPLRVRCRACIMPLGVWSMPAGFTGGFMHAWSRVLTPAERDAIFERGEKLDRGEPVDPCTCDLCAGRSVAVDKPNMFMNMSREAPSVVGFVPSLAPGQSVTVPIGRLS